ncbi:hypothetical protein BGZ83_002989 [Gryganskiella cystojenkinii]|nr:hypothetical protein BGZ83_002989 [Gryganskiella cystojenkinii]
MPWEYVRLDQPSLPVTHAFSSHGLAECWVEPGILTLKLLINAAKRFATSNGSDQISSSSPPQATFHSRFNVVRHTIPASSENFSLACKTYKRISSAQLNKPTTPPLLFAHANGFHKEIWEPVMARLTYPWSESDMYAFDCRNMGDSALLNKAVLEDQFDWYWYARDILQFIDTFGLRNTIGVGHSILAEYLRPGTFSAIIAIDPTMFPRGFYNNAPLAENPLGQATLKRRDTWKDRIDARDSLLSKKFFRTFHPESLEIYLEHGMIDGVRADGSSFLTLKGPKFQEAITFANKGTALFDTYHRLKDLHIPVHIISGETSEINSWDLVNMKREQCRFGSLDIIKGAGHLVSLEKPEEAGK